MVIWVSALDQSSSNAGENSSFESRQASVESTDSNSLTIEEFFASLNNKSCKPRSKGVWNNDAVYFTDGMYSYDCRIFPLRFEFLEHEDLKREDIRTIVIRESNVQICSMNHREVETSANTLLSKVFGQNLRNRGAHFVIMPNGSIYQTARIDKACYHMDQYTTPRTFTSPGYVPCETDYFESNTKRVDSIVIEVIGDQDLNIGQAQAINWLVEFLLKHLKLNYEKIFEYGQKNRPIKDPAPFGTRHSVMQLASSTYAQVLIVSPTVKSGKYWLDWSDTYAPGSKSLDTLDKNFATNVDEFIKALRAAGATVTIDATFRHRLRAWLFHWSWQIYHGHVNAADAVRIEGVPIEWDHGDEAKSRAAAGEMVRGFRLAVPPKSTTAPSATSNHIEGEAVDLVITWTGKINIKKKDGTFEESVPYMTKVTKKGDIVPNVTDNTKLKDVGKSYGLIHFSDRPEPKSPKKDEPHWSRTGG